MYFTLTSVLSYFEGFKLSLFNVIFYPKFSQKSYENISAWKTTEKQAKFGVAKRKTIVPRTTFDFELAARISQRSYIELGGLFAHLKCFFPILHHHVTRSFTISTNTGIFPVFGTFFAISNIL